MDNSGGAMAPLPVIPIGRSNILNASMVLNIKATKRSGYTIGRVIRVNLNHQEALSISAASYKYFGIAESPAIERHPYIYKYNRIKIPGWIGNPVYLAET